MRTYVIEARIDTMDDGELEETLAEVVADITRTLRAQTSMVNRSRLQPVVKCFWTDSFSGARKHEINSMRKDEE